MTALYLGGLVLLLLAAAGLGALFGRRRGNAAARPRTTGTREELQAGAVLPESEVVTAEPDPEPTPEASPWPELVSSHAGLGLVAWDLDGQIRYANHTWMDLHGFADDDEANGHRISLFFAPEQLREELRPRLERVIRDGPREEELGHRRKDGTTFRAITRLAPIHDARGESLGFVAATRPVAIPKPAADATSTEEPSRRSDESRGASPATTPPTGTKELDPGLRELFHGHNNVLTGILGNAHLVLLKTPSDAPMREEIEEIESSARRAVGVFGELRTEVERCFLEPTADGIDDAPTPPMAALANDAEPEGYIPVNGWAKDPDGFILVVDDHDIVRDVTTSILETAGLNVLTASDGAPAVEIFREKSAQIRAVVLDLTMPGMDGAEALGRFREIEPEVKVVLMTGHRECDVPQDLVTSSVVFLQKPFEPHDLLSVLDRLFRE